MALADEVKSRVDNQRLVNLTNDAGSTATSIDDTRLSTISTDIQHEFEIYSRENFNINNRVHVTICVDAVIGKLQQMKGNAVYQENSFQTFVARAQQLQQGNIRGPSSNSNYNQSDEREEADEKFEFTQTHWNDFRPKRKL